MSLVFSEKKAISLPAITKDTKNKKMRTKTRVKVAEADTSRGVITPLVTVIYAE